MDSHLDSPPAWADLGSSAYNRLLLIRATLATVPLSPTGSPDSLREAAWTFDGLCAAMENLTKESTARGADRHMRTLVSAVNASLAHVRQELDARHWDPLRTLLKARLTLLQTLVVLSEICEAMTLRKGETPTALEAVEVARTVLLAAVRTNSSQLDWIGSVAAAELTLLGSVPHECMTAEFLRGLLVLRSLAAECSNYESRRTRP